MPPSPSSGASKKFQSKQLLKFRSEEGGDGKAYLHQDGLNLLMKLPGKVYPVILMGDGRAGKSFLASRLLELDQVFTSSDSAEAVTEGIDCFCYPMHALDKEGFPKKDAHMLVLDCEGGNNAMAAIRTLVNVFGIILGTELVFVSAGSCSEAALQNLGTSLVARSLIATDANATVSEQRLVFVVNKTTLKYDADTLEKALKQKQEDPGRQETRDIIMRSFKSRAFFDIPMSGASGFESSIKKCRQAIVKDYRPLKMGGKEIDKDMLIRILQNTVKQMNDMNEISMPSMTRSVIMDGFLTPLVERMWKEAKPMIPTINDYVDNLDEKDPHDEVLAKFDELALKDSPQLKNNPLFTEARDDLSGRIKDEWDKCVECNEIFGTHMKTSSVETRDAAGAEKRVPLGGGGLLANIMLAQSFVTVEARTVMIMKNGTRKEDPWAPNGQTKTIIVEKAFQSMRSVPFLSGKLQKARPGPVGDFAKAIGVSFQIRQCCVKEGHFSWWDTSKVKGEGDRVNGCINLLVNKAQLVLSDDDKNSFALKPRNPEGWQDPVCFSGGKAREFWFSVGDGDMRREQWADAINQNIRFADEAYEQLGDKLCREYIPIEKPTLGKVTWRG